MEIIFNFTSYYLYFNYFKNKEMQCYFIHLRLIEAINIISQNLTIIIFRK